MSQQQPSLVSVRRPRVSRSGFTLVEMIVVIVVVLSVSGLAIGFMAPDNDSRRIREAARQISSMMQSARAKAIETGRPVGVVIEPDGNNPFRATSLQLAEVAPPYGGDFSTSQAIIEPVAANPSTQADVYLGSQLDRSVNPPRFSTADAAWNGLLNPGDLIRFNRQGHYFLVTTVDPSAATNPNVPALRIQAVDSALPSFAYYPQPDPMNSELWMPVPYEILRQPETSAGTPLELPDGIVIDLSLSGIGKAGFLPGYDAVNDPMFPANAGSGPIALMFTPKGQAAVWAPNDPLGGFVLQTIPFDSVFLMIGKNDAIWGGGPGFGGNDHAVCNTSLNNSYWVTVHHQTGLVTSAENDANFTCDLASARRNSIQADVAGGK